MRRHHEQAATIVEAIAMVLPMAGGLWARLVSLKKTAPPPEKPSEAGHDRQA